MVWDDVVGLSLSPALGAKWPRHVYSRRQSEYRLRSLPPGVSMGPVVDLVYWCFHTTARSSLLFVVSGQREVFLKKEEKGTTVVTSLVSFVQC